MGSKSAVSGIRSLRTRRASTSAIGRTEPTDFGPAAVNRALLGPRQSRSSGGSEGFRSSQLELSSFQEKGSRSEDGFVEPYSCGLVASEASEAAYSLAPKSFTRAVRGTTGCT